jgi:hypothetical protein
LKRLNNTIPNSWKVESMITTSFAYGESYSKSDSYYEDCEHDDIMTAEDYDSRRAIRDGWYTEVWDGR